MMYEVPSCCNILTEVRRREKDLARASSSTADPVRPAGTPKASLRALCLKAPGSLQVLLLVLRPPTGISLSPNGAKIEVAH